MEQTTQSPWAGYYNAQRGRAVRPFLVDALARFATPRPTAGSRQAIDLGCGDGTETLALLQHDWQVLAIDQEAEAIRQVLAKVPADDQARLTTQVGAFEQLDFTQHRFCLRRL